MNGDGVETGACKGDVWRNEASRTFETHDQAYAGILPMLRRLDERLASAVDAANRVFASRAAGDLYRGLAISPEDVVAALARTPGEPFLPICTQPIGPETCESPSGARLAWLQRVYGLTDFDLDVILVALAPEIDLRYERIYAYLHDDVSRRRPSVDLALNVLCASAGEKLRQRARFAADGPLVRSRVIEIYADPLQTNSPLLSHSYRLDEQIVRLLFIDDSCDSRLREFCRMVHARAPETGAPLSESLQQQLHALTSANAESPLRLYFHGPANCGQPEAAALLAEALSLRVLNADIRGLGETTTTMNDVLSALVREAWLREALLYLRGVDMAGEPAPWDKYNALWCALQELAVNCVIEGQAAWIPAVEKPQGVITIAFDYPAVEQREQWWRQCLPNTIWRRTRKRWPRWRSAIGSPIPRYSMLRRWRCHRK